MREYAPGLTEEQRREIDKGFDEMIQVINDPKAPRHSKEFQAQMAGECPPPSKPSK